MITVKPKYVVPKTLKEACSLLLKYKKEARVIAGGTDLLVQMKHGEVLPKYIINIAAVTGQDYIKYDEKKGLQIGALTTINSIETSPIVREKFGILAQAASKLGTWQVRNQATIGGNICNAATSADAIPALMVLNASVKILTAGKERTTPIEDFFTGPGQTILKPGELVTEVQMPNLPPGSGGVYIKQTTRKALDLAIIGVAVTVTVDGDKLRDVKIALGTAAPTPIRAKEAEKLLSGKKLDEELISKAAQTASDESRPRDSARSTAAYRRQMVKVLVGRALRQAIEQAKAK